MEILFSSVIYWKVVGSHEVSNDHFMGYILLLVYFFRVIFSFEQNHTKF